MMIRFCFFFICCLWSLNGMAQYKQEVLFSGQNGQTLLDNLVANYKPDTVLSYGMARDTMFSKIDAVNGQLSCVYTGYTITLSPDSDPTQDAFSQNINTEHTWPQSQGAGNGFARSNMHHLFPTRVDVNGDRGSLPFSEIPDNQTQRWYYLSSSQTSIPNSNIDLYSELRSSDFEPREDHKGDVARAMFYFYTVYRAEADAASSNYFSQQRETLCNWHYEDPVDETEWNRTYAIAPYQDDKINPFVLDCTLPIRTYCNDIVTECMTTGTEEPAVVSRIHLAPNPFATHLHLQYELASPAQVMFRMFNVTGQQVDSLDLGMQLSGEQFVAWKPVENLPAGSYFYQLIVTPRNGAQQVTGGKLSRL